MEALNFATCPHCGSADFSVRTQERLYGSNHLQLTVEGDRLVTAEFGLTEPDWSSCVTVRYEASCCGEELPEDMSLVLDEMLPNFRQEEE